MTALEFSCGPIQKQPTTKSKAEIKFSGGTEDLALRSEQALE
jgi:hypothetical protein